LQESPARASGFGVTPPRGSAGIAPVNRSLLPLLLLALSLLLSACSTLANRRELYTPNGEENRPWTRVLHHHSW
jgi:hypothetical protein